MQLSSEQQLFINEALKGSNILVDACIGSGKTTAIQHLCNALPSNKRILYLTYNKLLKLDAKDKIKNSNATVTNYHGFAYMCLLKQKIKAGISDLIQTFNNLEPDIPAYDILMIDEYQDIDLELAQMLEIIKESNPNMQMVAVGDMAQKIYDKTTLDAHLFIDRFLGGYKTLEFTQCFRLSEEHAAMLGRVWNKKITGVNKSCRISTMDKHEIVEYLKKQDPHDVLCLGARMGDLSEVLNRLEAKCPEKYNKNTIYASIRDSEQGRNNPQNDSGIFTTFDSSKGLERKICVVFDFTKDYWMVRSRMPQQKYEILRNIFCVAASRGKEHIIFVDGGTEMLDEEMLSTPTEGRSHFDNMNISEMFDFKYKEDVEKCYKMLSIKKLRDEGESIDIKTTDGLIDLSPCIGIYQEASYFDDYDLEEDLKMYYEIDKDLYRGYQKKFYSKAARDDKQKQILILTAMETKQNRYIDQVDTPFIAAEETALIHKRISRVLSKDETIQQRCEIKFGDAGFSAMGRADVVKNGAAYELKFVDSLKHEHFLQCACYMLGLGLKKGILWNIKDNTAYGIKIKNKEVFYKMVLKTITKGMYG